jgi:hypothetical protein
MRQDSPYSVDARTSPNSAQIVQVETLGRLGLVVMLAMFVVIVALAFYTGRTDGLGEARAENTAAQIQIMQDNITAQIQSRAEGLAVQMRTLNARVEVIQWEFDKASAQLIEKGLITPPE